MFQTKKQTSAKQKKIERNVFNLDYNQKSVHSLSGWWSFIGIAFILLLGYASRTFLFTLPNPLYVKDASSNPTSFIADRAWADLAILNEFGPRVVGSYANEVLAVDFLKREIAYIQTLAHPNQTIELDVQKITGAYWLDYKPYGITNGYRNIQNVVVKLIGANSSKTTTNSTLLINCHFDSVPGSPGASDDAASCCVMLEILRVMSKQSHRNQHSIVFLFNGAEETPLQAAHGFIAQHKWAGDIKAFINLESAGSNGREVLFQAGPNHSWLIDMYKKTARHPLGQTLGEELFQSGLIPSDTDFRVFRDFGNIPGLDFAHPLNGYRYHTKYDNINYLSRSVLQNTGDNILPLATLMANSDELSNPNAYNNGKAVYFDLFGHIFISYSQTTGRILNVIVAIVAIWLSDFNLRQTTKGLPTKHIRKEMFIGFGIQILSLLLSIGVCGGIAYELDMNNNTMSWYHHNYIALLLYCVPSLLIYSILHRLFAPVAKDSALSLSLIVQARLNGVTLMWSILIFILTAYDIRGTYMFMVPVFAVVVSNFVIGILQIQNSIRKWLYVHLIGQTFVVLWTTYASNILFGLMIPITGRSGATHNPELLVGIMSALLTTFVISYLAPLIRLLNKSKLFLITLISVFIVARVGLLSLTHIGFPYRDDSTGFPTPQRHMITHTIRTFYDPTGKVRYTDSGFWFRELDRNAWKTIESLVAPDILIRQDENAACAKETFCGLPIPSIKFLYIGGFWLPGPKPILREEGTIQLMSTTTDGNNSKHLDFLITGNVQLSLHIRPKPNVELIKWNLTPTIPPPHEYHGRPTYFAILTGGGNFNFSLTINSPDANPQVDITIVSNHFEYHREHTPIFARMLNKLPSWAFPIPSVASVVSRTFG